VFPFIARFAFLVVAGRLLERLIKHPRVAPIVSTRKGRLALLVLGVGLRRHPRTRLLGRAVPLAHKHQR
jgi:hypothetical protein